MMPSQTMEVMIFTLTEFYLLEGMMDLCVHVCVHTQSCLTVCDSTDCSPPGYSVLGIYFSGNNTGVGSHFLLQGIFPTQRSNQHLFCFLNWQVGSLPLYHLGRIQLILKERGGYTGHQHQEMVVTGGHLSVCLLQGANS